MFENLKKIKEIAKEYGKVTKLRDELRKHLEEKEDIKAVEILDAIKEIEDSMGKKVAGGQR